MIDERFLNNSQGLFTEHSFNDFPDENSFLRKEFSIVPLMYNCYGSFYPEFLARCVWESINEFDKNVHVFSVTKHYLFLPSDPLVIERNMADKEKDEDYPYLWEQINMCGENSQWAFVSGWQPYGLLAGSSIFMQSLYSKMEYKKIIQLFFEDARKNSPGFWMHKEFENCEWYKKAMRVLD